MFDLRALRYFVAAYEEGSITAAARRCFVAQPSVTHAIQSLEAELVSLLFTRSKSGLSPTPEGEKLYGLATRLLAEAEAVVNSFRAPADQEIRLQVQPDMHLRQVSALIRALHAQLPAAKLKLCQGAEEADLRLVTEREVGAKEWSEPLWEEDYVAAVPASHPKRFNTSLGLSDLEGLAFIERSSCAMNQMLVQVLAQAGIRPDVRAVAEREEIAVALVELGIGVAILPRSHCEGAPGVVVLPLRDAEGARRRVCLACNPRDAGMVKLVRELKRALRKPPGASPA